MSAPMMRMAMRSRPDAVSSAAPLATAASASAASVPSRSKLGRVSGCKSESFSTWSAQAMSSAGPVAPMHSRMVLYARCDRPGRSSIGGWRTRSGSARPRARQSLQPCRVGPLVRNCVVAGRALAQPAVHLGDEGVDQVERHEGLDGATKAATVDADGASAVEHVLGQCQAYIEGCSEPSLATTFCRYMAELAPDSRVRTRN